MDRLNPSIDWPSNSLTLSSPAVTIRGCTEPRSLRHPLNPSAPRPRISVVSSLQALTDFSDTEDSLYCLWISPATNTPVASVDTAIKVDRSRLQHLRALFFEDVLPSYSDVFPDELPPGLPPHRAVDHEIDLLPGSSPPNRPPIPLSPSEHAELSKVLDDLLSKGFIEVSKSPFGAPVFFVRKKEGSLRLVVDYRLLNLQTI